MSVVNALSKIGCGLYAITCFDGVKHNAMINNTVFQVTSDPERVAVSINKSCYTHDVVKSDGIMNINILGESATFRLFEDFGFRSGRDSDKLNSGFRLSENGRAVIDGGINSFISLKAEQYIDLGTHGLFICAVTEQKILSDEETMTYSYYHENVKPKPDAASAKGWVCQICGYVYEGEELPDDFKCPWCLHGKEDFTRLT